MKSLLRNRYILVIDIFCILFATLVTYLTVFTDIDFSFDSAAIWLGLYIFCVMTAFFIFKVYRVAWYYSGTTEYMKFFYVNAGAVVAMYILGDILYRADVLQVYYRRVHFVISIFSFLEMMLVRIFVKEIYKSRNTRSISQGQNNGTVKHRVLIIGAGDAGKMLLDSTAVNGDSGYTVAGFIDDDFSKHNKTFHGVKVLGGRDDIVKVCERYDIDKIVLAIPSAYVDDRKQILEICHRTKCDIKTMPGIDEILSSEESNTLIRDVRIEDLLERDPVILDNKKIIELVSGENIMVTGGGGSIGSELCRQIMRFSPKKLIIVDIYENNAYDIQMELNEKYPDNKPEVIIASIRDRKRLEWIFKKYSPKIVFHAAAHKHVPLMEVSPGEAIKNNVFGTYNLAACADKYGVEKFVMISTDKAVNPTNVMGATKRLCEMIIQCMETISNTDFVAVRFGNVLGSNGSVIPLFKRQIENGGPVRVTHKEVTRFFMTIPEAAQLVIQAACYADGGEIFVLDMGKPVKIYDLAENLIRLSGYTPGIDMNIEISGLRPGEKLYEELLMEQSDLKKTQHKKIFVDHPEAITFSQLEDALKQIQLALDSEDDEKLRDAIEKTVPTYIRDCEKFNSTCPSSHVYIK